MTHYPLMLSVVFLRELLYFPAGAVGGLVRFLMRLTMVLMA